MACKFACRWLTIITSRLSFSGSSRIFALICSMAFQVHSFYYHLTMWKFHNRAERLRIVTLNARQKTLFCRSLKWNFKRLSTMLWYTHQFLSLSFAVVVTVSSISNSFFSWLWINQSTISNMPEYFHARYLESLLRLEELLDCYHLNEFWIRDNLICSICLLRKVALRSQA